MTNQTENERREMLKNLKYGAVVKYNGSLGPTYLIVTEVKDGIVSGCMASPVGVNSISIDELVKRESLSLAEWKTL